MKTITSLAIAATVLAAAPALAQSRSDQSQYNYNRAPFSESQTRQNQYGQSTSQYDQSRSQYNQSQAQQMQQSQQMSSAQAADASLDRDVVAAVQQRLQQQGYQVGSTSGQISTETRNSVLNYQARNGLRPTGQIDLSTLASMGIGVNVAGISPSGAQAAQRGGATSLGQTAQGSVITVEPQTAATPIERFPDQGRNPVSQIPGQRDLRDEGDDPETIPQGSRTSIGNEPGELDPQEVAPSQRYTTSP